MGKGGVFSLLVSLLSGADPQGVISNINSPAKVGLIKLIPFSWHVLYSFYYASLVPSQTDSLIKVGRTSMVSSIFGLYIDTGGRASNSAI